MLLVSLRQSWQLAFQATLFRWKCTFYGPYFIEIGVKWDKYPQIPMEGHTFKNDFNLSQNLLVLFFMVSQITTQFLAAVPGTRKSCYFMISQIIVLLKTLLTVYISYRVLGKEFGMPYYCYWLFVWYEPPKWKELYCNSNFVVVSSMLLNDRYKNNMVSYLMLVLLIVLSASSSSHSKSILN